MKCHHRKCISQAFDKCWEQSSVNSYPYPGCNGADVWPVGLTNQNSFYIEKQFTSLFLPGVAGDQGGDLGDQGDQGVVR